MIDLFEPRPVMFGMPSFVNTKLHIEPAAKRVPRAPKKTRVTPAPSKRLANPKTSAARRAQMHAHYLANKEKYFAKSKSWAEANPEKAREAWKQSERRRRTGVDGKCGVRVSKA